MTASSHSTHAFGTRAYEHAQTKPVWCAGPCGLPIMGSRLRYELSVVADVWRDAEGKDMKAGRVADQQKGHRWHRREVFHPDCYDGRYGEVAPLKSSTPVRSRI